MVGDNNLNGKILSPLIDFDLIVNMELGLIRFIRENFQDERAFKLDILNKSDREILSLLYSRKIANPISIISTEDNMKDIDELYTSFFEKYKKEIIARSVSDKNIYDFISIVGTNGNNFGVNAYIAVRDDYERNEILSHFPSGKFGFVMKTDKAGMKCKDIFYVSDYRFFTENGIDVIIKKKIYMLPKQYSLDYFEEHDTPLTSYNVLMTIGTDYRKDDENEADQESIPPDKEKGT